MLLKYHAPVVPAITPQSILAALAFLVRRLTLSSRLQLILTEAAFRRSVAVEVSSGNTKSDKYWRAVEEMLESLYQQNGDDREHGEAWKQ